MRILQLIRSRNFAGSEQYMLTLSRALVQLGHECVLGIAPGGRLEAICQEEGWEVVPVPMNGLFPGARLAGWLAKHPVDIVHTHLTGAARIGRRVARKLDLPCVSHLHIYRPDKAYGAVAHYRRGRLIAVSQHLAAFYRNRLQLTEEQVRVAINATAAGELADTGDRVEQAAALCGELSLPADARLLLLAGRLSQGKGQDIAISALPEILKSHPQTNLLLAGVAKAGTRVESELKALADSLGVGEQVHFLGFRRDVPRLMRAADLCLLPSRMDVMPLVAVEAMRLGACLVAARVGGLPEIVEDGRTGVLVEPASPSALAEAVAQLLDSAETVDAIRSAAAAYAATAFDPVLMARKVEAIYQELLGAVE